MKLLIHIVCSLALMTTAGVGAGDDSETAAPFELTFIKRLPKSGGEPVYDAELPGFRLDAQIATLKIRPRGKQLPGKLTLIIRTTQGLSPMLEMFTLKSASASVSGGLKLPTEEVADARAPLTQMVSAGTYFKMKVVGQEVHVVFEPKAMRILADECTISWVDWFRN